VAGTHPNEFGMVEIGPDNPALLVVASPGEAVAVWRGLGGDPEREPRFHRWESFAVRSGFELLVTGVGKACAAGAVATVLDPRRHGAVINLGIAGSLPIGGRAGNGLGLRAVALADLSVYGDEGIETPGGFHDVASMGFSPAPPGFEALGLRVPADPALLASLRPIADRVGPIATVSTCAGTDVIAQRIAARTGAIAEAMEGAAVGFTSMCVSASGGHRVVPFAEVRVISNTTGDRDRQRWDLPGALDALSALTRGLAGVIAG